MIHALTLTGLLRKNNTGPRRRSTLRSAAYTGGARTGFFSAPGIRIAVAAAVTFMVLVGVIAAVVAASASRKDPAALAAAVPPTPSVAPEAPATPEITPEPEPDPTFDFETGEDAVYVPPVDESPAPVDDPYAKLNPGETNPRVMELQERLMDLDYMENDEPTEFYGFVTQYSLQLFQREHGLLVDGIAGPDTLKLLFSDEALPYVVRKGDRGTDILEMQKQLRELGYLKERANGTFGEATLAAVQAFQKRNGLKNDGVIGSKTREALYSEKAKPAPTPKPTPTPTPKPGTTPKKATPTPKPGATPKATAKSSSSAKGVDKLIDIAQGLKGKKYVFGAKGPSTFDCSGFVYYCLKEAGVSLRYMTSDGWRSSSYKTISSMSDLRKGDILCFDGHVGIYQGNGTMIDASSSNGKVRVTKDIRENSYWTKHFICAKRVFD